MIVTHKISMDLERNRLLSHVDVMQGDKYSRNLEITLVANSAAWQIPEGATAIIRYSRPDGTGGNYEVMPDGSNAYTISDNVLTVAMAPAVCAVPGPVHLAVGLINDAQEINTFAIDLHVRRNPGLEVTSTGDYKILGSVADSGWTPNMYLGTDEDGNVVVKEAPETGGATDDQVAAAVAAYLEENPVEAGATAEQAAQIQQNTDDIAALPVTVTEDGYTEISGLRQPVDISFVQEDTTVTVTTTLQGDETHTDVITLNDNGYPVSIVSDGVECAVSWEGF